MERNQKHLSGVLRGPRGLMTGASDTSCWAQGLGLQWAEQMGPGEMLTTAPTGPGAPRSPALPGSPCEEE